MSDSRAKRLRRRARQAAATDARDRVPADAEIIVIDALPDPPPGAVGAPSATAAAGAGSARWRRLWEWREHLVLHIGLVLLATAYLTGTGGVLPGGSQRLLLWAAVAHVGARILGLKRPVPFVTAIVAAGGAAVIDSYVYGAALGVLEIGTLGTTVFLAGAVISILAGFRYWRRGLDGDRRRIHDGFRVLCVGLLIVMMPSAPVPMPVRLVLSLAALSGAALWYLRRHRAAGGAA